MKKDTVIDVCEKVYNKFKELNIPVLFDDRNSVQAGVKFKDCRFTGYTNTSK
jgi:prolyl-tRNA synthetase